MARKAKKARAPAIAEQLTGKNSDAQVDQTSNDLDPMTSDQTLARLIRQFNQSADASRTARFAAEIYRDYYDGKQWSDDEVAKLNARGQPAITDNRIKDKVEYLLGLERETRTDPKAYPRTPEDDPGAEAATDALRYVADCNYFQQTKSGVFENMAVEGYGGCEVIVENSTYSGTTNKTVCIRYIRWDRLFYDSHSLLHDFADSRYQGIIKWMDLDEARAVYKDKLGDKFDLFTSETFLSGFDTYDDKPRWFDRGRKRIQICEHYYKDGDKWMRAVYTRVGFIEEPAESAYKNCETDKPECPLLLQSLYVDRDGNRYGVVKRYKDLQDEINKRRSKSLHLLSVNQATAEKGAVDDVESARKELARPDGFLEYTPGMKLDIRENTDLAEGQFKLLQQSIASMADTGPNESLQGNSGDVSGRKAQLDQQGGTIQLGILSDRLRYWQTRVMKASWSRVKQFWTGEMWVRVTDDENSRFMAVNSKYPANHIHVQTGKAQEGDPMNVLSDMDVDIIIDEAPDTVTLQQEQFQTLAELAKSGIQIPPQALIEASSLSSTTKRKVMDAMSGKLPDGTQIPPQVQQMLQQKEQQIQQISQAQQQKAQEQMQAEQQLNQQKADALLQQTKAQAALDKVNSETAASQAMYAARQQELTAQMEMLNAKEIELKSLQLLAAANLKATQDAANQVVEGASKEQAINTLTSRLEQQQSDHAKQVSDLGLAHNAALHQEREKARAATSAQQESESKATPEKSKPREVKLHRDPKTDRIIGATVN
jgi:hypothetical protein